MKKLLTLSVLGLAMVACGSSQEQTEEKQTSVFPYELPKEKPNFKLSQSMERLYDNFEASKPQDNELYTQFKYTALEGFDYNDHDGTITRRDPSRIVRANGKYYMWYTLRNTPSTYVGAKMANDTIPSSDWDLSDIGYATSVDGFTWEEQGVAVHRPAEPNPGWRSISTPDILVWKGKYYLYYQAFSVMSGKKGDDCPVALSWADTPDGPWHTVNEVIIPNGEPGSWDQFSIHDPHPIVFKDKIYLYYKSDYNKEGGYIRSHGLAVGTDPLGPFEKCDVNPVVSSGHETEMFRFKEGIACVLSKDGMEANTIQYAEDGINFKIASITTMVPEAGGFYDPDAFTNVDYARGVTWGISHINLWGPNRRSVLLRFDCDLCLDVNNPRMKRNIGTQNSLEELLQRGLTKKEKEEIIERNTKGEL